MLDQARRWAGAADNVVQITTEKVLTLMEQHFRDLLQQVSMPRTFHCSHNRNPKPGNAQTRFTTGAATTCGKTGQATGLIIQG